MKVKMTDDLVKKYKERIFENQTKDTIKFLKSISGKEIQVIFTHDKAYEMNEDKTWLPKELWTRCEPYQPMCAI